MTRSTLARYFLYLGATGFGGPVALANKMHEQLVIKKKVLESSDFREAMTLAHLLPGPLAIQVAIYIGWKLGGFSGGTIAGFCFTLPSFIITVSIAWIYVAWSGIPFIQAAFQGVAAAVASLVLWNSYQLSRGVLSRDRLLWGIAVTTGALTLFKAQEPALMFLFAAVITALARSSDGSTQRKAMKAGTLLFAGAAITLMIFLIREKLDFLPRDLPAAFTDTVAANHANTLQELLFFFLKSGAFIFGSGLVIIPFMRDAVLNHYQWLNPQQFLDAVAVGFMTPGPALITVAFIGFLVAGLSGALVSSVGIFSPSWVFTLAAAPFYQKVIKYRLVRHAVDGISAAAVGAIAGAGIMIARDAIKDPITNPWSAIICVSALAVLAKSKKFPDALLLAAAGLVGILVQR